MWHSNLDHIKGSVYFTEWYTGIYTGYVIIHPQIITNNVNFMHGNGPDESLNSRELILNGLFPGLFCDIFHIT